MPTIIPEQKLIIFDEKDWLGGLHPQGGEIRALFKPGYDIMDGINPFKSYGSVTVGEEPSAVTNVALIDGVIKNIVPNTLSVLSSIELWGVGGTKVYSISPLTGEVEHTSPAPHAVASSVMEDVVIYNVSGVEKLLYSYNTASKGDIGMYDLASTWDDNYWDTTLTMLPLEKGNPHPMLVGDDDILYIGDGNIVKSIDGSTPEGNESALDLPVGFVIRSFSKLSNNTLVIFADQNTGNETGKAQAFFWDYSSPSFYAVYDLDGTTVGGAKEYLGSVAVITKGLSTDLEEGDRDLHLLFFNGSRFESLGTIEAGAVPTTGGIEVNGNYLIFNSSGKIYSFGTPFYGINAGLMNIQDLGGALSGAVVRSHKDRIIASSGSSSSYQLELLTGGGSGKGTFYTTHAEPVNTLLSQSRIKAVRVEFLTAIGSATSRRLDLLLINEMGLEIKVFKNLDEILTAKRYKIFQHKSFASTGFRNFQSLQLYACWHGGSSGAAPIIRRVLVEYEHVDLNK